MDFSNEIIADHLLNAKQIATYAEVNSLDIDEIISKASGSTTAEQKIVGITTKSPSKPTEEIFLRAV